MPRPLVLLLVAGTACTAAPLPFHGTWEGKVLAAGRQVRLVLHVTESGNGSWSASAESPDQGIVAIPVERLERYGRFVRAQLRQVGALLTATLSESGDQLTGEMRQGLCLALVLSRAAEQQSLEGEWRGTLAIPPKVLAVVVRLRESDGRLQGALDSPDQGIANLLLSRTRLDGSTLSFQVDQVGGVFIGVLNRERTRLEGHWWQGPQQFLHLRRRGG